MKIEDLNRVTKYYRDRGYRGDFTGKKGHERLIKGMELLGIKVPKIMRQYKGNRAGGVGLATVELGKAMGAKVIAAASTEDKINLCKKHGADEAFIYPSGKLDRDQQKELSSKIKELTGGIGANVVYDPIGDSYSEPCIRATAWDGRYLVIGFAAGEIPKIPINLALLKGMKIVGVFWGAWVGMFPEENKKNFEELFKLHSDGKINPEVSDSFSLDDGAQAIAHLKDRKAKGKVIIKI